MMIEAERIGEREAALCSISVAELAHGVHRANTPERRERRRAFLDDLKAAVAIYPITADTAELIGKIHAETARRGVTVPFDDLLIGACALERGYAVATRNQRHFEKIPGLKLLSFYAARRIERAIIAQLHRGRVTDPAIVNEREIPSGSSPGCAPPRNTL